MIARPERWPFTAEGGLPVAAGALAVAVFLTSWVALHHGFYTRDQIRDTPVYQRYGDAIEDGAVPYRDFRPEYPPAALPVFAVPSLVDGGGSEESYRRAFEALMAACGALMVALMAGVLAAVGAAASRLLAAVTFAAAAPLALGSVILSRYDLWPALLTVGALAALVAGRDRLGAGVLGLATAAKLYPAVIAPLALVWVLRRRGRRAAAICAGIFAAVVAACYLPFVVVAPEGVADSLERQLSRPLQIESLGAAVLLAIDGIAGLELRMESSHGSQNIAGTAGDVVGAVQTVLQALALLAIWALFARGPTDRERLLRYAAAAVLAFVAFGKVLSPQFMIWLIPLVPLVRGRRGLVASALLAVALVLTQLWFPFRYWDYALRFDDTVTGLVLARDLALVAALAVLVTRTARESSRS